MSSSDAMYDTGRSSLCSCYGKEGPVAKFNLELDFE